MIRSEIDIQILVEWIVKGLGLILFHIHLFRSPEEQNLNGHKGTLPVRQREEKDPKQNSQDPVSANKVNHRAGSKPSIRPNAMKNRGKQLEALKQMEERIQRLKVCYEHQICYFKILQRPILWSFSYLLSYSFWFHRFSHFYFELNPNRRGTKIFLNVSKEFLIVIIQCIYFTDLQS